MITVQEGVTADEIQEIRLERLSFKPVKFDVFNLQFNLSRIFLWFMRLIETSFGVSCMFQHQSLTWFEVTQIYHSLLVDCITFCCRFLKKENITAQNWILVCVQFHKRGNYLDIELRDLHTTKVIMQYLQELLWTLGLQVLLVVGFTSNAVDPEVISGAKTNCRVVHFCWWQLLVCFLVWQHITYLFVYKPNDLSFFKFYCDSQFKGNIGLFVYKLSYCMQK